MTRTEDPDASYVVSFQDRGDRKSFDWLFHKYRDWVFNFCLNFLNNEDDAADCTQEVFIRAFRNIGSFRFESRFSTWLYRIAINTSRNYYRDHARIRKNVAFDIAEKQDDPSPDPHKSLSAKEAGEAFREGLELLNESQRNVIVLRDVQGMSYEEIARAGKMKIGTVRSTLARARYRMAEHLKIYKNGM